MQSFLSIREKRCTVEFFCCLHFFFRIKNPKQSAVSAMENLRYPTHSMHLRRTALCSLHTMLGFPSQVVCSPPLFHLSSRALLSAMAMNLLSSCPTLSPILENAVLQNCDIRVAPRDTDGSCTQEQREAAGCTGLDICLFRV